MMVPSARKVFSPSFLTAPAAMAALTRIKTIESLGCRRGVRRMRPKSAAEPPAGVRVAGREPARFGVAQDLVDRPLQAPAERGGGVRTRRQGRVSVSFSGVSACPVRK